MAAPNMTLHYQLSELHKIYPLRTVAQNVFELGLKLPAGVLYISIQFRGDFPSSAPLVYVAAAVTHPWIGPNQIIRYPQFQSWSPSTPILSIVQAIEQEFLRNPPKAIAQQPSPNVQIPIPDFNKHLSQLRPDQLSRLNNEEEREILIQNLPEIQELTAERDRILNENISKTIKILEMKSTTDTLNSQLTSEYSQLDDIKSSLDSNLGKYDAVVNKFSYDAIKSEIEQRSSNHRAASRDMENLFYSKQMDIDTFVESYMTKRCNYHMMNIVLGHF